MTIREIIVAIFFEMIVEMFLEMPGSCSDGSIMTSEFVIFALNVLRLLVGIYMYVKVQEKQLYHVLMRGCIKMMKL